MGNAIGITIGTDGLLGSCFESTAEQVTLGCGLEEHVITLRDEFHALRAKKNDVVNRVRREEGPDMMQLDEVADWISKVTNLEVNITDLIQICTEEIHSSVDGNIDRTVGLGTSIGCCANISCKRRKLDKKVAQKLREVANLMSREFASVVCGVHSDPLPIRNIGQTTGLETSIGTVLEHIDNDEVRIIGLYGMGGVGKTTLLTKINNKLCDGTHGFDLVIWVKVSDNSIENIQHQIGRKIRYPATWEKKSQVEKADDIFTVLKEKSFVLLLDDIRTQFELKDVGIPLSSTPNKSKVIFTTRSLDVCAQMDAQRKVNVKCLEKVEAWELFKSKVGDDTLNRHPRILELAKLVAKECDGLPLALIVVGLAMACKSTPEEWSRELSVLKKNAAQFTGLEDKVFGVLRLSYDNLPSDTARECFLYCILFPGDFHIPKKKLINYWFGEGFVLYPDVSYNKYGDDLEEGYYIIGTLINASLLEDDKNGGVKMHDVIRDMALWLASDCGKTMGKYLVQARAELIEVPSDIHYGVVERVSLASNSIKSLPQVSVCRKLLTLLLNDNVLNMISDDFFRSMPNLRVLDLSGNEGITELPNDIYCLISLQYLNLAGTGITNLPSGLSKLKYLDLTHTRNLGDIHDIQQVLHKLRGLRVLKMFGCGLPFSSIYDLLFLPKMLLSITIRSSKSLNMQLLHVPRFLKMQNICIYRLGFSDIEQLPHELVVHFTRGGKTERLEITDCEFTTTSFPFHHSHRDFTDLEWKLRSVFIVRCSKVQNLTWLSFAGCLTFLLVAHCKDIEVILSDGNDSNPFDSLEEMYLIDLPELHSVSSVKLRSSASASTSTSEPTADVKLRSYASASISTYEHIADVKLRSLRFIGVEDCPKLMNVSVQGSSETTFIIQGSADWWDALPEKPAATNWITPDFKEEDEEKNKSSSSASASTSTSKPYPDTHLPNFFSYD